MSSNEVPKNVQMSGSSHADRIRKVNTELENCVTSLQSRLGAISASIDDLSAKAAAAGSETGQLTESVRSTLAAAVLEVERLSGVVASGLAAKSKENAAAGGILLLTLKTVAEASIVLAALLYATGWPYLYQYYKTFGVSLSALNLPIQDPLIFSFPVIFDSWRPILVVAIAILAIGCILSESHVRAHLETPAGTVTLIVTLLLSGFFLSWWATIVGEKKAYRDMRSASTLPYVSVITQSSPGLQDSTKPAPVVKQPPVEAHGQKGPQEPMGLDNLEYKLLVHANGQYYVFRPPAGDDLKTGATSMDVYAIPDSQVLRVYIQRSVKSSDGRNP